HGGNIFTAVFIAIDFKFGGVDAFLLGLMNDDGVEPLAERHAGAARRGLRALPRFGPQSFQVQRNASFHARPHSGGRRKRLAARTERTSVTRLLRRTRPRRMGLTF